VDASGNLIIADTYNNRIRMVDTNGVITTLAGSGPVGSLTGHFSGDGGPATSATLNEPISVSVDPAGNLFIADLTNQRIRKVDASGIIMTVAGNGINGSSGDGGPATNASFAPWAVALDNAGNLFIADPYNNRIRRVSFQGPKLVLNDVGSANTGAYDVVVSGAYGSVTSSIVNVAVTTTLSYTITVNASPIAGGTVSGGGTFAAGSAQTVTGTANSGYTFANWTENGSIVSSSPSYTFTLSSNLKLVANFATNSVTVTPPTCFTFTTNNGAITITGYTCSGGK
jgi:Divergent InlB B-repeat domain